MTELSHPERGAGQVITASYSPREETESETADPCRARIRGGSAFLYIFDLVTGAGYFADESAESGYSRRFTVGAGLPTQPQITIAEAGDDMLYVKTSAGVVLETPAPPRDVPLVQTVYWRHMF